jgi:hypothetical protein
MSINGIGSYQISANSLYPEQTQHANAVESDGDIDRSRITAPVDNAGRNGLFSNAISQTLFQIGVTPTAANVATGAAPTGTQQQAVAALSQSLFGALQAAGGDATPGVNVKAGTGTATRGNARTSSAASTANSATTTSGGIAQTLNPSVDNTLQNRLQNLIAQLGGNNSSAGDTSENPALAQLQQSFQAVVASQGNGSSPATLTGFLQTLAQNVEDAPSSGSLINVQA